MKPLRPCAQHEANLCDLELLLQAIQEGDPKRELEIRVQDIRYWTKKCLEKYAPQHRSDD